MAEEQNKRVGIPKKKKKFLDRLQDSLKNNKKVRSLDRPFQSITEFVIGQAGGNGNIFSQYNTFNIHYGASPANKLQRYRDYDIMEIQEPMIGNALDAWASNATLTDILTQHILIINSNNEEIKEELEELFFVTLDADTRFYDWIRGAMKYGDYFIFLKIEEDEGVTEALDSSPYEIAIETEKTPYTESGFKTVYVFSRNALATTSNSFLNNNPAGGKKYEFYPDSKKEQDSNFNSSNIGDKEKFDQFETLHFTIPGAKAYRPYGVGVLENARYAWKQYRLMQDAVLIYRVVRAPSRLKFKIEVGTLEGREMIQYMNDQMNQLKRVPLIDQDTGNINEQYHVMSHLEDYVLPRKNGFGSDIEELPGGSNTDAINDVEMFKSSLRSALKVPKAFLEYDEALSTARGLAMEDARFASNVQRMQRILIKELYKVAYIHLLAKGYDDDDLSSFTLSLVAPSTQTEKDRLEIIQSRIDIVGSMKSNDIGDEEYYYREILKLDASEVSKIFAGQLQDKRRRAILATIESQGNANNIFPGNSQLTPGQVESFGGGGGMGGGDLGGGLGGGDLGGGFGEGDFEELGGDDFTGDIEGLGDEQIDTSLGGVDDDEAGKETPTGGTETAQYDTLRLALSNDLITRDAKSSSGGKRRNESLNRSELKMKKNMQNLQNTLQNALRNKMKHDRFNKLI